MKKKILLLTATFLFFLISAQAQSSFGLKGGLSYNSNGDLSEFTTEANSIIKDKGKGKSGYNIGVYGKIDLGNLYIRPELVYTKTTSEYELNSGNQDFELSKIDAPVLLGFELIGPLSVFAGPSFQYILDNNINGIDFDKVENEFTMGLNIGASLEFGRLGIDVRYERGLNENEAKFVSNNTNFKLDTRPEQIIVNLSFSLTKSNK
ncbi:outer membrane beta-barrel protein [Lutibacter maritimus]|uniref:Outer membrane protein beta-barrel domain-containing protein n=1 Tax=Lutibacter maritimus TaxID=593133 RepID=A0A1I6NZ93_9FLAO|nr:outer membrane beta-barrel protein [Lutibacter maritimus]SFS33271.1 Outer membrane protein beta-barrel domain-containing protein [Lutibacter maritimus]